jgi:TctA family transporter
MDLGYVADAFVSGFLQVFSFPTFGYMLIGIALGFAVGILPGLGGAVTLALMLPFTFKMAPVDAFAFLLGMLAVTGTTGDITSVLFGVPGEASAAATVLDGHAMAKNGEAGRALGAVLTSSMIGAVFGAFILAASVPFIRPVVLSFASPEFLMLTVLGITFVSALSGGQVMKGLIMGGVGFILSMVGLDPQSGVQRYTLGQITLWDGIGLVPVAVGLFAVPEIVEMAVKGTSIADRNVGKLGGVMEGVKDTFRHLGLTLRCSAIGTLLGVIPGLGVGVSQWMSYAHAVQSSPGKERFGKGAVEGVLGPGASNNSSIGGSLMTTIAFGVPSGVVMAILLGAFLIQGINPGPKMLTDNLPLTMSFVWVIVVSNVVTVLVCFTFLAQIARLTFVRVGLLIPPIILLVYVGAFSEKNAMLDLLITMIFGLLALVMVRADWPRAPLVLGLVLGRLAESYLFLTNARYALEQWLTRPVVIVLVLISLLAIVLPIVSRLRSSGRGELAATTPVPTKQVMIDIAFALGVLALIAWTTFEARNWAVRARLFPWAVGIPVLLISALYIISRFVLIFRLRRQQSAHLEELSNSSASGLGATEYARNATLVILGWMLAFALGIWAIGFAFAGVLMTFLYLRFAARERWLPTAAVTVGTAMFFWTMVTVLHVPFPNGFLLDQLPF